MDHTHCILKINKLRELKGTYKIYHQLKGVCEWYFF